jgi:hypothetical protein
VTSVTLDPIGDSVMGLRWVMSLNKSTLNGFNYLKSLQNRLKPGLATEPQSKDGKPGPELK